MASKNDITGDELKTKATNKAYEDGWDSIFNNKEKEISDIANEHPNVNQFETVSDRKKAVNKIDHLKWCMQGQAHIDRPEYVWDVIDKANQLFMSMNNEQREYLHDAKTALEEAVIWNKADTVSIDEDDGYTD